MMQLTAPSKKTLTEASDYIISDALLQRLETYVSLFQKWQSTHNLIAPSTLPEIWTRHIVDSLQILKHVSGDVKSHLDLGSGGGLPAIVMACAKKDEQWNSHLIESVGKKTAFLNAVRRELQLPVKIFNIRIEKPHVDIRESGYDLITARALADLTQLFDYSERFLHENSVLIFPKGDNWRLEIAEAEKKWRFKYDSVPSLTRSEASILIIKNLYRY